MFKIFIRILEGHLLRQAEAIFDKDWRLVMDNDRKHTARKVKRFISEKNPEQLPWHSQSPDINPIENFFGWLKQELLKGLLRISQS